MTVNLPESDIPDIRDYLLVDSGRVRSLVAQMHSGLPASVAETHKRSKRLEAGMSVLRAGGERATEQVEQRELDDIHVSMLEESATALGFLVDGSELFAERKNWLRNRLKLAPGSLVRVTAPTRFFDPRGVLRAMEGFVDGFRKFPGAALEDTNLDAVLSALPALYGDALSLRIMPCGVEEPECAFVGVVSERVASASVERETLFSRLGADAPLLTTVFQVARVGDDEQLNAAQLNAAIQALQLTDDRGLARDALDKVLTQIMRYFEGAGLMDAPRRPGIAVNPLAVYRQVPRQAIDPAND